MGVLKTIMTTVFLAPLLCAAARAEPGLTEDATICAGRLSAQLEFQWLMRDPASKRTEVVRDAMLALLDATDSIGDEAALSLRIEAKHAHAALLQRATFTEGGKGALRAKRRARRNVSACTRLVAGFLDVQRGAPSLHPKQPTPDTPKIRASMLH